MVERRLDVYCLSNMGLHVLIDGHSILIDALNNGEQRPYAGIPLDMAQTIIRGGPPYERVDMMLISHHHEDHFDAGLVARFVLERPHVPVYSSPQVPTALLRRPPADWNRRAHEASPAQNAQRAQHRNDLHDDGK